jgi:EpsI family protein
MKFSVSSIGGCMPDTRIALPVFMVAQILLVHWAAGTDLHPEPPDPRVFPAEFGDWQFAYDDGGEALAALQLRADLVVNRTYRHAASDLAANVFVAWYQWQDGFREPHAPQVCLPASGWLIDREEKAALQTAGGNISLNRLSIHNAEQRGAMLYWYQTPRHAVAGEWSERFWHLEGAVRNRRTDVAFVRVFVPFANQEPAGAMAAAESMGRVLYPSLRKYLPE